MHLLTTMDYCHVPFRKKGVIDWGGIISTPYVKRFASSLDFVGHSQRLHITHHCQLPSLGLETIPSTNGNQAPSPRMTSEAPARICFEHISPTNLPLAT